MNPEEQFHAVNFWNDLEKNAIYISCKNISHASWFFEDDQDLALMSMSLSSVFIEEIRLGKKIDLSFVEFSKLYPKSECDINQK